MVGVWDLRPFKLRLIADAVIIQHTLFSLPFVLAAVLLETNGHPSLWKLLWIVLAAVGARNAANAFNRIADREIDAKNPRTAGRHLPSGRLSTRDLWIFTIAMLALLCVSAAMLNWLCVALLPVAAALVFGYSYAKRITWLCHFWLGIACCAATMGAFLGLEGAFHFRYFFFAGAVALWVTGFDILYALQDIEIDRAQGLKSIPARFGPYLGRMCAAACHVGTVWALAVTPFFWNVGYPFVAGLAAAGLLLIVEQSVALGGTARHIRVAAYGINEIIPMIVLAGCAVDVYLL
jgi:4-hydroxybenzoate polyprenyltransferase